ncbi:MAG: rRNA methyltransferase [Bacteroidia bacterium]|nr:MAG: rRNA methyltransferase [Bacteroidia bacterium]
MKITHVTSLDLQQLQPYRTLRRPEEHHRRGIFVAEGEKVVRRLLESTLRVFSALLTPEWFDIYKSLLEHRAPEVYVAPKQLVESIVGFPLHQGIMAVGGVPESKTLETVLPDLETPYFLAAIDGLTNAENIGVLVRNCAALGVQAILVGETSSSPYLRRAVRNSMGAVFHLTVVHTPHLARALAELRSRGITTLAAHPSAPQHLESVVVSGAGVCVVFGSEGEGISANILRECNLAVSIPMKNNVDSLNVGSASAVFLYEVQKILKGL